MNLQQGKDAWNKAQGWAPGLVVDGKHWTKKGDFLVGKSREARGWVRTQVVLQWVELGFERSNAERFYGMKVPFKHELVPILAEALGDGGLKRAIDTYEQTPAWRKRWMPVLEPYFQHVSLAKLDAFVSLYKEVS